MPGTNTLAYYENSEITDRKFFITLGPGGYYPRVEHLKGRVGTGLTCKHYTRVERLARDKHFTLLRKSVNYGRNKFYNIGPKTSLTLW